MREAEAPSRPGTSVQIWPRGSLLSALDEYRRAQPDPPTRAKATIQLLEKVLLGKPQERKGRRA
jgi:hypothetical protein